jgi:subfamily B ATP-binding cassette protein MsbA
MKKFKRIFVYLSDKKQNIFFYVLFNLSSNIFSVVSLAMLAPFMQLLFGKDELVTQKPELSFYKAESILLYLKYAISKLIIEHPNNKAYPLAFICIVIVVSIFLKNFFTYMSYRVLTPMRTSVMKRLREDLFNKILVLPVGYFTEQKKGDIISRMSNDTNEIEWSVMTTLEGIIREPLTIIIILSLLIAISPLLSLFLFVLLPVAGILIGKVSQKLKRDSTNSQEKLGELMSILEETLGSVRIIKAFNAESFIRNKFFNVNHTVSDLRNKMMFKKDLASPMSEFLGVLVLSCILWFGGKLVLDNALDAASLITYIVLFTQIINPAKALTTSYYNLQKGSAALERIDNILNAPNVINNPVHPKSIDAFNNTIEFKNVSFAYNNKLVLKNINLNIHKGKTIALVGSSGAGKSTLSDLIPRFHDVTTGEILIDGVNIKEFNLTHLRSLISIVTQEPILFNDTIYNNIILGNPSATEQQVTEAAKIANAYNYIIQKPNGFNTNIGDRGNKLSGGEKQRLTIARALVKNPPILILDEATSSLDTESEKLVQEAINNVMQNRTSIIIAHRLSTIKHADEIIVLDKGEIVERGKHDELINQNGIYSKLVKMQELK